MSFEYLRDKRANLCFADMTVLTPDVSGMSSAMINFLLLSGWFVGSSDVSRKFRRSRVPTMVESSDVLRLTDLDDSLSYSYRTCSVFIPDVFGMDDQRPTASFQMP